MVQPESFLEAGSALRKKRSAKEHQRFWNCGSFWSQNMVPSRRSFIKYASVAPLAVSAITSVFPVFGQTAVAAITPAAHLGIITGNDPAGYQEFSRWFGRKPRLAALAFNQNSASDLSQSISYICQQGKAFMAAGAQILWSVPCPGARQLEAIVAETYHSLYTSLFQAILAVSPKDSTPILVRLPWEFNLAAQQNAAIDSNGKPNAALFIEAWIAIANIAKAVSSRFSRIWCPNVTTEALDPLTCWPGTDNVEIISQDFYMQKAYNKAGDFSWFLHEARGLKWCADFARSTGKPYGLSEWGMDSDIFVDDLNSAASWLSELNNTSSHRAGEFHHHCWWDRSDAIDCRISNATHPALAAAYKKHFY
jgi:hypothetical protein